MGLNRNNTFEDRVKDTIAGALRYDGWQSMYSLQMNWGNIYIKNRGIFFQSSNQIPYESMKNILDTMDELNKIAKEEGVIK